MKIETLATKSVGGQLSRQSVKFDREWTSEELDRIISGLEQLENNWKSEQRREKNWKRSVPGFADWSLSINLIIYDSRLLPPFHFRFPSTHIHSLSTHKHRERNLIKYQSLLAIRVWPMGMLDTRPQFWISIGVFGDWFKGSAKWRINTVYTWKQSRHSWYLLHFKATRTFQFEFSKFPI